MEGQNNFIPLILGDIGELIITIVKLLNFHNKILFLFQVSSHLCLENLKDFKIFEVKNR